jgi:hypothetical protein
MKTVISIRCEKQEADYLRSQENTSRFVMEGLHFAYPDIKNPPVIEYTALIHGWMANGPDFCGDPESECIFGTGHTKEAAKEDYLSQWREQQ